LGGEYSLVKVDNIEVWGFKHAIRGMRNPMNSWDKSDSIFGLRDLNLGNGELELAVEDWLEYDGYSLDDEEKYVERENWLTDNGYLDLNPIQGLANIVYVGPKDLDLMTRLCKSGPEHRKFMRQIFVSFDLTLPFYVWKEFDTYKIGTVANSCSTMHKIAAKEFTRGDFSYEHLSEPALKLLDQTIDYLNYYRDEFLRTKNKETWWQLIQLLPSSYNQKRTVTMTYENVITIIRQRTNHKLDEWNEFIEILKEELPYITELSEACNGK
jgi:hypothetical protein